MLELEMLYEKRTINYTASQILSDLNQQIGLSVCQLPMAAVMNCALEIKWTREPGDRVIVANAIANDGHGGSASETIGAFRLSPPTGVLS
jgi:PIN domain nuclease of toxin-antitoxin system